MDKERTAVVTQSGVTLVTERLHSLPNFRGCILKPLLRTGYKGNFWLVLNEGRLKGQVEISSCHDYDQELALSLLLKFPKIGRKKKSPKVMNP